MSRDFKLIPAEIPSRRARGASVYGGILEAFSKSAEKSVRVDVPDRKPATVALGLRQALKKSGLRVAVIQRGAEIYLKKD